MPNLSATRFGVPGQGNKERKTGEKLLISALEHSNKGRCEP